MALVGPSLALVAYADAWLSGAKVVVFGDSMSALPERLLERGARFVSVYDADAARVAEATQRAGSSSVSFAPLEQAGSTARDGSFDVGIVEDIASGGPAAARLLETLARALGRRGVALVATRNAEVSQRLIDVAGAERPAGYYDLYELVRAHFDEVRMLGQTPFVGYAIADFGAENDEDIQIDTALVPGGAEDPEWFVALASQRALSAEAFSVVQLPFAAVAQRSARQAELERSRQAEKRALARVAQLEAEQSERKAAQTDQSERQLAQAEQRSKAASAELARLQAQVAERDKWLAGLEARAATADQRADDMQVELERLRDGNTARLAELARLQGAAGEGSRQKSKLEDERNVLRAELGSARQELGTARQELGTARQELISARQELGTTRQELGSARQELGTTRQELGTTRQELGALRKQHDEELGRRSKSTSAELDSLRKTIAGLTAELVERSEQLTLFRQQLQQRAVEPEGEAEIAGLEEQLRERGREVARLEQALQETERFGKQLIVELERLKHAGGKQSAEELKRLAHRNAELTANLEAMRWAVAQLEASALVVPSTKPPAAPGNQAEPGAQAPAAVGEQPSSGPVG